MSASRLTLIRGGLGIGVGDRVRLLRPPVGVAYGTTGRVLGRTPEGRLVVRLDDPARVGPGPWHVVREVSHWARDLEVLRAA